MQTAAHRVREVVGLFAGRDAFDAAVLRLTEAGFDRADLSVLASHESLQGAGKPGRAWRDALVALVGETKYEWPLVASGAILLAGGPLAATVAALVGAAVGGVAMKELLDEVTATPHTAEFAQALDAGAVILWVRADDDTRERQATAILQQAAAGDVHTVERDAPPAAA